MLYSGDKALYQMCIIKTNDDYKNKSAREVYF